MADYDLTQTGQEVQDILDGAAMQTDLTAETERAELAEQTLQGGIDAEETRAKAAEKQNADDIDVIESKIPARASDQNQLADKDFVNNSIATATATYRGAYNLVNDLSLTVGATHEQIATALAGAISTADNNDYCFVQIPTSDAAPTQIASIERYKFNGTVWAYEYTLNNSGFTAAQWAALNSGITSGLVAKLLALPTNDALTLALAGKQDVLTFDSVPVDGSNNPVKSGGVYSAIGDEETRAKAAEKANADDIDDIEALIPAAASDENQLADKEYVNSSISTATATYRGSFNEVNDLGLNTDATHEQIATALAGAISTADNNDYCFVQIPTSDAAPTQIASIERYKFNGTVWAYEYTLNNSGFTAAQWAALNSGITSGLVAKLSALPTNDALTLALAGKQDVLTFDNEPTSGSNNPVKSGGVYDAVDAEATTRAAAIAAIVALIPEAASALNQLADKAFVNSSISTATAVFKGTYNVVVDLELSYNATQEQIATMLASKIISADNNDYCFVQIPTSDAAPLQIARTDRYKFNGTAWAYEYTLNNSGFTAAQWAAINSGITSLLKDKLIDLPTATELTALLAAKQNQLTFDTTPTTGSTNPVTSGGIKSAIDAEKARAEAAEADRYTKSETYNKTEINGMVSTPHQNYVTVPTYASLPSSGQSTDTIYRVSSYDGANNQVDDTVYSEYAWDGTQYVFLRVNSQIEEVFDITVYNNNTKYADLSAALGVDGANIPATLRRGGMSVKFVQSSDNKYVQYRLMSDTFNTTESNWQGVDDEPTTGSFNLVKSGGVCEEISQLDKYLEDAVQNGRNTNYINGVILLDNNELYHVDNWGVSDYIPYNGGDVTIYFGAYDTLTPNPHIWFYNSSKDPIDVWGEQNQKGTGIKTITASEIAQYVPDAAYFRFTFQSYLFPKAYAEIDGSKVWEASNEITGFVNINETISALEQRLTDDETGTAQNFIKGKYIGDNNTIVDDAGWGITDHVPYTQGNDIEWKWGTQAESGKCISLYDANKNYIDYWGANGAGLRTIVAADIAQYAPNAAYIRASFLLSEEDVYIKVGNTTAWTKEGNLGLQFLNEKIEENSDKLSVIEERIDALDSDIISLNSFKNAATKGLAAKIGSQFPKISNNYLCIAHISDIHGDAIRMQRMIQFANAQDNISAILATGDFEPSEWGGSGFDECYAQLYQTANIPMLPLIGNHDVGLRKKIYSSNPNTNEAVAAKYISPYMSANECVQGGENKGYYYKDFNTFKVRLIVLNEYEMPRIVDGDELKYNIWQRYLSQTQVDWLLATLSAIPEGWSVIISMHQLIDIFIKADNEFKGAVPYYNDDIENAQGTILQDIIDAYINRTIINKSYVVADANTSEVPTVTVNTDFTNAKGEFICWINGHTHNDGIGESALSTQKQIDINVTTGSANLNYQACYDDLFRDNNSIAQDAFNLIAIDTDRKEIRVLRIGANVTIGLKRRDYAVIGYSNI